MILLLPQVELLLSENGFEQKINRLRAAHRFTSLDSYPAGDTFPYWERENTGDPELFAQEYIDYCINNLYPDVGCPGTTSFIRLVKAVQIVGNFGTC